MLYTNKKNINISKMTLGTVQLGMNYGINNTSGVPSKELSFSILNQAYEGGVTILDTSDDYGNSEEIIGEFLKENKSKRFAICTKFKLTNNVKTDVYSTMRTSAINSIKNLNTDHIDILMSHTEQDYINYGPEMIDAFARLKKDGLILNSGISLSKKDLFNDIHKSGAFDAFQIPLNVFDNKEILDGTINKISNDGTMVFVRSVYLQGLFFKKPSELCNSKLSCAIPYLESLDLIAKEYNLTASQLAFLFIRDSYGVDSLVVGSETPEQVLNNVKLFEAPALEKSVLKDIQKYFSNVNKLVISPWEWSK